MKNGKRPHKKHKIAIKNAGMNPSNWLVTKNLPSEIHIVHKLSGNERVISLVS